MTNKEFKREVSRLHKLLDKSTTMFEVEMINYELSLLTLIYKLGLIKD